MGLLDPVRHQLLPVDARRAMRFAERVSGLHDYGGGAMHERLEETIDVVSRVDWNVLGRFGLRYILNWHLTNRLRLVELLKRRPRLERVVIERPLIVTGLFRTGTTYLHNLLAADPSNRAAHTWEVARPVGRKRDLMVDEAWRKWRTGHEVSMDDIIVPEQAEAHRVTVDGWEEDFFLLENDMAIMKFFVGFGAYDYGMRMLEWDMVEPYGWHKKQLQVLWAQRSADRWLLKCPWHLWNLEALLKVYPDACIVQTHRDPVSTIGSQCSLSARIAMKFQRGLDLHDVGRFWLEYSRLGIARGDEARARFPRARIYDVHADDLQTKPLDVVRDMYAYFDLPFDEALDAKLRARVATEPTAQAGDHEYDSAHYGLSVSRIEGAFSEYRARFAA
ncbi:MAG: sulfotransferase [Myxococcota bacterium]